MRQADVVIPIYADVEKTRVCIEAVLECSGESLGTVFLIEDCSPDAAMRPMLRALRNEHDCVRLIENGRNLGFVASVNRGMALRTRDVVILNSDTRVTEGWLRELLGVFDSNHAIAAASPLSNNAGKCSVPHFGQGVPSDQVDHRRLELQGLPRYTEMPTAIGFCMLLRDEVLKQVGPFDEIYGRGYNEENDWCQRVRALGFIVVRANHAFVYHEGQVSFGPERDALDIINARRLIARYPHYLEENQRFDAGPHARIAAIAARRSLGELRVLRSTQVEQGQDGDIVHHFGLPSTYDQARALFSSPGHVVLSWQPADRLLDRALTWACLQSAQAIIVSSSAERRDLVTTFGVSADRIYLSPPEADVSSIYETVAMRPSPASLAARGALLEMTP